MKPDRFAGLKINEVGVDQGTKEFVLVTNCICSLPHDTQEAYNASHDDGCLMVPFEGLVFTTLAGAVVTWNMQDIRDRVLVLADPEDAKKVKNQMDAILEEDRKREKVKNFKGRR